jgi:hypothetical protein
MKPEEVGEILADAGYARMEAIALLVLMLEERSVLEHRAYRGKLVRLLNDPAAIHERIDRSARFCRKSGVGTRRWLGLAVDSDSEQIELLRE